MEACRWMNIKKSQEYLFTTLFSNLNKPTIMDKLLTDCAILQESTSKNLKENLIKNSLNGQNKLANLHSNPKKMILLKDKMKRDCQLRLKNILGMQL